MWHLHFWLPFLNTAHPHWFLSLFHSSSITTETVLTEVSNDFQKTFSKAFLLDHLPALFNAIHAFIVHIFPSSWSSYQSLWFSLFYLYPVPWSLNDSLLGSFRTLYHFFRWSLFHALFKKWDNLQILYVRLILFFALKYSQSHIHIHTHYVCSLLKV